MTDQHATTSNQNQAHSQTKVTPKTSTKAKTKPNTSAQDKPLGTDTIRWDLSDLYRGVDDPGILNDVQSALKQAQLFQKQYKGKLSTLSATQLATAYAQCEALLSPVYKASQYVGLLQAIDSLDDTIKALETKIDDLETEISNQLLFFDIELGQLPAEMLDRLIQDRGIGQYRYELQRTKETARHNLTEPEEKILNIAGLTGASAFKKLYNELTASFEFEFELDGVVKK